MHGTRLQALSWPIIAVYNNPSIFNCYSLIFPCFSVNTCWQCLGLIMTSYTLDTSFLSLQCRCLENADFFTFHNLLLSACILDLQGYHITPFCHKSYLFGAVIVLLFHYSFWFYMEFGKTSVFSKNFIFLELFQL